MSKLFDELVQKSKDTASVFNNAVSTTLTAFVHSEATQRAADGADLGQEHAEKAEKSLHKKLTGIEADKVAPKRRLDFIESFKERAENFMERNGRKLPLNFKSDQLSMAKVDALNDKAANFGSQIEKQSHVAKIAGSSALMLNAAVGPILLAEGAKELKESAATGDGSLAVRGTARTIQGASAVGTVLPAIKGLAAGSKFFGPAGIAAGAVVSGSEAYDANQEAGKMKEEGFDKAASIKNQEAAWRAGTAIGIPATGLYVFSAATALSAPVWFPVAACVGVTAALSVAASYGAHLISDKAENAKQEQVAFQRAEADAVSRQESQQDRAEPVGDFTAKLSKFRAERQGSEPTPASNSHGRSLSR